MTKKFNEDGRKKTPFLLKILLSIAAILVLLVAIWLLISYDAAVKTADPVNERISADPSSFGIDEWDTLSLESDGNTLSGWYLPASENIEIPSDKIVIMSHNYESNRAMPKMGAMYLYAELLNNGYDIISFDYAGCGESSGRFYSFGSNETKQLNDIINHVHDNYPDADIAVMGWAFGAASAICAGCENENVSVIISDSSYTDLPEYFAENMNIWTQLPGWLFNGTVTSMVEGLAKADFKKASPINALGNCSGKSFLFIHCDKDTVINPAALQELTAKAQENNYAEQWIISDCRHIDGFAEQQDNYINNIITFLNNHLN